MFMTGYSCLACGKTQPPGSRHHICPSCGGNLDVIYDYQAIAERADPDRLAHCPDRSMWRYLDLLLPQMSVGGVLLFDNLLWKGWVAESPEEEGGEEDAQTAALRAFNPYLMIHPQLRSVLLPLGDGVGLATKIKPTVLEMGGPF